MIFRVALLVLTVGFMGCSSSQKVDSSSAEGAFAVGERYEKDERYEEAIAQFEQVKNKFPYSNLATEAKLRIADINYKREEYAEAQAAYETFKELHPSHPRSDYVTYRLGMSLFYQLPETIDRDLSLADKSMLYFDEVASSYPNSEFATPSREQKQKLLDMLAQKEIYIADFYFKRGKYDSALGRYAGAVERFPQYSGLAKALKGAAISAKRANEPNRANEYLNKLNTQFANSKEAREAKEAIDAD